jgi:p24 family protein delta-1
LIVDFSAHFVSLVLPDDEAFGDANDTIETWYFDQIYAMTQTKQKHNIIPKHFVTHDNMPDVVAQHMSSYIQSQHGDDAHLNILITATPSTDPANYHHEIPTKLFHPTVLNYVGRTTDAKAHIHRADKHEGNIEGYGLCFSNTHRSRQARVVFDIALISDRPNVNGETVDEKSKFNKDAHLTPLEMSLDESIRAATVVLREMKYMEQREARMRETAESINTRVRWFSYLSVSVLLSVTYIQVSYLKRYFHKKKLM